ncbi:thioredoxin domain-containing protein [Mesorhizobium sp. M1C.F.Ca.ET.193.01.1.1]|uniref:thioredoxin domain-containing protein n=2 Tax=Mesorhizobium TaxID=68287 RepID=UPI000FD4BEA6|nr:MULTISPECIES: thioredoxin domain-containing protein [unclassified Mesorhizobium]TGS95175.1 thioredoxin domain-containing protein [bacterium M00.F.Ca.ET.177.01.1.1]TGQ51510.1 thioredoxin domain-containing protein [Mesorhizobium sp. M1C.F.Ca.ET.210.01.1.1]TGQ67303.1 thioredoxin domain-containing protein [Mesorhizobium sp. M1C.F.Ca.ET.212.01.1.1]TGR02186.1 thioredoxin domain-containing protein [Mesorhizobium sp. M1C.F.Ca.ET.204.01.1.1]TGR22876.1 thioredoxin domain-containing protein [Mesorhizo
MTLPARNLLAEEASPYLQQHSDNPVHWRAWSPAALAEAKEIGRPILLSIGYAACHWCHVMAHESFENDAVAAVMNRLFVNIKVDREERPDIDQIYMAALHAMGEQGGWPLTMFLTPDGKPFWGGTYFPRDARYGRPGFIQVLEAVDKAWREKQQSLAESADGLTAHVEQRLAGANGKAALDHDTLADLGGRIDGMIDRDLGGLRGAPKFPNAPFMHSLWLSWLRDGRAAHRDAVLLSLEKMLAGGIYDHVGGGLSRYSTDAEWLVPHFEKMLYDNAQLIRLCNWSFAETGNDLFRIRIEETVTWLLREMRVEGGAFAASLDADSDGEEGLFYTWSREEIESALGDDSSLFLQYFELAAPHGWEGKPIIRQSEAQQRQGIADRDQIALLKAKLLTTREKRVRPGRDGKALTDWNGLMIAAIAEAGRSFGRPDWIEAAAKAFTHIVAAGKDGRLPHSMLGDKKLFPALSSDYAAMTNAAVALFEATGDPAYSDHAKRFIGELDRWHQDDEKTGYYLTATDSGDVLIRIRGDVDEAIPSATSQIVEALVRFSSLTGDSDLWDRALTTAENAMGRAAQQAYGQAGIVNACALALEPLKLVIIERPESPSLVPVANRNPDPRRVDIVVPVGMEANRPLLPGGVLPSTDKPGAWFCTGQVCLPVVTDATELEKLLRRG